MIEALRLGEAAVISPVRYTSLIWAAAIGYAVWGDLPDAWLAVGSAVIVAAGIYMVRIEARRKT